MKNRALQYLNKNPLLHVGMIDPILRETASILYAQDNGVLLKENRSQVYMISAADAATGRKLLENMTDCHFVELYQSFLIEDIKHKLGLTDVMACYQAVYSKQEKLPLTTDLEIRQLSSIWYDAVREHYDMLSPEDLKLLLDSGSIWGGFSGGNFAGFIGNHLEGSIGLLEIFPEFRGRGYGKDLEAFMVNLMLDQGRFPYTQIVVGNTVSFQLQKSLGFDITEETLYWLNP